MALVVAVSASFFGHTIALVTFEFFAENQSQNFFWIFLYKPVLGSPDNTLTKF